MSDSDELDNDEQTPGDNGDAMELSLDDSVPDPLHQSYRQLLASVERLPELPMQAAAVRRVFEGLDITEIVWALEQMLRGALWGRTGAAKTVMATVWWLIEIRRNDEYETIKELFESAYRSRRGAVLDLFREVPPHRALALTQHLPEVRLPTDREVTLGERRAMASGPKRRLLERLLMDPNPLVIRKLLINPQIRLQDIKVLASRRPTTPELLQEVIYCPRWFRRHGARDAVVRNPYGDTGLALKLLPTLGIKTLRRLVFSGDLHPLIQESAKRLVKLREERTAPWRV